MYLWVKAIHLTAVILWLGALMGLGLILSLALHEGANKDRLGALAKQWYLRLNVPAMGIALAAGISLIVLQEAGFFRTAGWLHTKLLLVLALVGLDHAMMHRARRISNPKEGKPLKPPAPLLALIGLFSLGSIFLAIVQPM